MIHRCFKSNRVAIRVKFDPLEATTTFSYLRYMVTFNNINWEALYRNLWYAQSQWELMAMFLEKKASQVKAQVVMYKAVVQAVIIFGSKIWVFMDPMMKVMEGFNIVFTDVLWG